MCSQLILVGKQDSVSSKMTAIDKNLSFVYLGFALLRLKGCHKDVAWWWSNLSTVGFLIRVWTAVGSCSPVTSVTYLSDALCMLPLPLSTTHISCLFLVETCSSLTRNAQWVQFFWSLLCLDALTWTIAQLSIRVKFNFIVKLKQWFRYLWLRSLKSSNFAHVGCDFLKFIIPFAFTHFINQLVHFI